VAETSNVSTSRAGQPSVNEGTSLDQRRGNGLSIGFHSTSEDNPVVTAALLGDVRRRTSGAR
jgi:hypothetical protein